MGVTCSAFHDPLEICLTQKISLLTELKYWSPIFYNYAASTALNGATRPA